MLTHILPVSPLIYLMEPAEYNKQQNVIRAVTQSTITVRMESMLGPTSFHQLSSSFWDERVLILPPPDTARGTLKVGSVGFCFWGCGCDGHVWKKRQGINHAEQHFTPRKNNGSRVWLTGAIPGCVCVG